MKPLAGVLAAAASALALISVAVFGLRDNATLVPPPEAAAEGFVRQLATNRFERAVPYLSKDLAATVDADSLRALTLALESALGSVRDVHGVGASMHDGRAVAWLTLEGDRGSGAAVEIPLVREAGVWKVEGVPGGGTSGRDHPA